MLRPFAVLTASVALALPLRSQTPTPATRPEASGHSETSSATDVQRFVDALFALPHGDRLTVEVAGKSHEGRAHLLVKVALPTPPAPAADRLRALVIGNIHAGEVEGKEAIQLLLREFAEGKHASLLERVEPWFLPIHNLDGNEATGTKNRPGQNGPAVVGQRANAQGLDLNRDFVKADAPETRTLLGLFTRLDPHLFVDLHTTNGSYHGYHLTYAPSLSPNVDRGIARLSRQLLDDAQAALLPQGYRTFDYGNTETRDWDGSGAPESAPGVRGWFTYDHRARYGVNYFGLRNRIAILSEAYSYDDFATRIAATRAFVLALLEGLAARADEVRRAAAVADRAPAATDEATWFGFDTTFAAPEPLDVWLGEVDTVPAAGDGTVRYVRKGAGEPERLPVVRAFRARQQRRLPAAWAIPEPAPEVVAALQRHGIRFAPVEAARRVAAERFVVEQKKKPKRPYQGHQELVLVGTWQPAAPTELQLGTIVIDGRQPLARLAATLLEPESEDSLSTWNFFEARTTDTYPVLRLPDAP
jgi:hypothetical protein